MLETMTHIESTVMNQIVLELKEPNLIRNERHAWKENTL